MLIAAAALAGCSAPGSPARIVEQREFSGNAARGDAVLKAAMIDGHNRARAVAGLPPLAWDDTLADHARTYADMLAQTGRFEHADQPQGPAREGENLFTGTRGAYRYGEMVQLWADEQRLFVNRPTPGFSTSGNWADVAHYTQIVWHSTSRVGCALASSATDDVLVCRYSPAGNVVGERAY